MGCSPFENSCFQMGVTVMGFAEDFGLCILAGQDFAKLPNVKLGLKMNLLLGQIYTMCARPGFES